MQHCNILAVLLLWVYKSTWEWQLFGCGSYYVHAGIVNCSHTSSFEYAVCMNWAVSERCNWFCTSRVQMYAFIPTGNSYHSAYVLKPWFYSLGLLFVLWCMFNLPHTSLNCVLAVSSFSTCVISAFVKRSYQYLLLSAAILKSHSWGAFILVKLLMH